jgi:hypothetical protein
MVSSLFFTKLVNDGFCNSRQPVGWGELANPNNSGQQTIECRVVLRFNPIDRLVEAELTELTTAYPELVGVQLVSTPLRTI